MEGKRYKLLKDLPDGAKIGDEYKLAASKYHNIRMWNEAQGVDESVRWETWQVENNTEWFELISDKPEKIEVRILPGSYTSHSERSYFAVEASKKISQESFPAIQSAVQNVLNETGIWETHQEVLEKMSKMFTLDDLKEAFYAGGTTGRSRIIKSARTMSDTWTYQTFEDYAKAVNIDLPK